MSARYHRFIALTVTLVSRLPKVCKSGLFVVYAGGET